MDLEHGDLPAWLTPTEKRYLPWAAQVGESLRDVFVHPSIPEVLNLQEVDGQAKAYQIRQLLRLIEWYHLRIGAG